MAHLLLKHQDVSIYHEFLHFIAFSISLSVRLWLAPSRLRRCNCRTTGGSQVAEGQTRQSVLNLVPLLVGESGHGEDLQVYSLVPRSSGYCMLVKFLVNGVVLCVW